MKVGSIRLTSGCRAAALEELAGYWLFAGPRSSRRKNRARQGQPDEHRDQRAADRDQQVCRRRQHGAAFPERREVEREGREGGEPAEDAGGEEEPPMLAELAEYPGAA